MVFTSPGPILFSWGGFTIRWYGFLIALALIVGTWVCQRVVQVRFSQKWGREWLVVVGQTNLWRNYWLTVIPQRCKYWQQIADRVGDLVFWLVAGALPGARAYYVAFKWDIYQDVWSTVNFLGINLTVPAAVAIWEGGIAIHGAILGGAVALLLFAWRYRLNWVTLADGIAPALVLGQAIGRWGNFFNSEAFGAPTNLPWKLYIAPPHRPPEYADYEYFHPTFLYESLWNIGVFVLLLIVLTKYPRAKDGTLALLYLVFYSLGRIWIEGLRTDSLMLGNFRIAQLVSLVAIVGGIVGLYRLYGGMRLLQRAQS
ncbi:MAG: prolipoprotein diacylglyceryl transferase [Pseudanabaenaceae cyanobacterium SKYGB_i_bin29]|nr:prolipoprotein diacylglyceryl transferase [Pseudanabaenaceae cyanobacterium SKYG29]MDW8422397.1 prolipoprotein diacylglyceryl transferase [Pseudanabaenaceae cyanobacterium SKYGB_i_bin29]